jgi:hypothetical protein
LAFEFDMSEFMADFPQLNRRAKISSVFRTLICGALATMTIAAAGSISAAKAEDGSRPLEQPNASIANPLAKQSLQSLSATLNRPLFAPSRRPPPPEPKAVARSEEPPPPPPQPAIVLVGTMIDALGPQAILRSGGDNKDLRVRVGDDISGWKVKDINESRLTLSLDERIVSVGLFPENGSVQNQAPNQAAPQKTFTKRSALREH